ncbi:putative LPS assembly protein LptD [Hymenobacter metallicola]|uniref:LPS-assembly protein LptD n=1 Tax=Hymenobacter metallicola TaxID=2563114 RepID=A0A4Z0PYT0_9BACT|nr:putative LPS assembly protein LptD [Hymenobacter metallicola]TGE22918.1 LPS-assembly protein LptD [Hymenobacter metallicola]
MALSTLSILSTFRLCARQWPFLFLAAVLWLSTSSAARSQTVPQTRTSGTTPRLDSNGRRITDVQPDTARRRPLLAATDSSAAGDSLRVSAKPKGDIETTIKYSATDSIRFEVQNKVARLFNKSSIDYGDLELKAARITVDYSSNLLTAEGAADTTGKVQDKPVFKDAGGTYAAGRINYNFKTKRGKIAEAVTQQGEGYVHAETIKKNELNEIFGRNGRYTTCNLEHPHFFINATKMKVIPKEKVVTGPFNLVIGDIPTPLGFLFGYFPTPGKSRASGLIFPSFGQTSDRGFALRNGGYYWVVNDNIGVRFTGDVYSGVANSFGGFGATAEMQYLKRYSYNGLLNFSYSQRPPDLILRSNTVNTNAEYRRPRTPRTFWLSWSHTPTPRPGGGRFSASVQAGSSDYNQQNSFDQRRYLTPSFSSTISYQKQIRNSPVNYALQLTQSQNTATGSMDFTLPDITVGVARQYPYEWLGLSPRGRFYEQFSVGYTFTGQNRLSNSLPARGLSSGIPLLGGTSEASQLPVSFSNLAPLFRNSQTGVQHQFQIALGSYTLLKHLNVSPSVNYGEVWYNKRLRYSYNEVARAIRIDTVRGFNRVYNWSGGVNLGTNVYGTLVRKGTHKIQAIRHKLTPSLNYSYAPDYTRRSSLYWVNQPLPGLTNSQGQPYNYEVNGRILNPVSFSRYQGFLYGTPSGTEVSQISFSLQNQVEMKVRNNNDTTGTTPFEKVSLIDGLDFSTGYNLAADSFRLQPLSAVFRTQIARKLNVNVNANFVFYQRDSTGRLLNKYLFEQSRRRLARLATADLSLNYQFNPAQGKRKSTVPRNLPPTNDPTLGTPNRVNPYEDYVDFEIPWELSASFTTAYTDPGPLPERGTRLRRPITSASITASGSVKLTSNFRFGYNASYDFVSNQVVAPSLDFYRDLHCWQISGNWRPFGLQRGYFVTIAAKSSLLQDLKLNRNRSFLNR